jgi:regulator of protease activity HflC (stomatin/prohibitin superfamily)
MDVAIGFAVFVALCALIAVIKGIRVIQQYERGVVFRLGQIRPQPLGPGLNVVVPIVDRVVKVNMQIVAMAVPAQDGITRDNITVRVDAVVYFRVIDPVKATVNVQNYLYAISQVAQTSLRSVIGRSELD